MSAGKGYAYEIGPEFNGKIVNVDTLTIYASGFRNPWRMTIVTNTLYTADVGNGSVEEVNAVHENGNYGWPCFEGTQHYYDCTGTFIDPVISYSHALGSAIMRLPSTTAKSYSPTLGAGGSGTAR